MRGRRLGVLDYSLGGHGSNLAVAVLFDNEANLLDGLSLFERPRPAASLDPLAKRKDRCVTASPWAHGASPMAMASSPAPAISPSLCATRPTCSEAPAGAYCWTNFSMPFFTQLETLPGPSIISGPPIILLIIPALPSRRP